MDSLKRIKILFVVNKLRRRGTEQQLFSFVKELPRHVDVSVFRFSSADEEFPEFFNYKRANLYSSKYSGKYNLLRVKPLFNLVMKENFDVIITVGMGASLFFGRACGFLSGVRIIYSILGTFENFHTVLRLHNNFFDIFNKTLNYLIPYLPVKIMYRLLPNSCDLAKKINVDAKRYPVLILHNGLARKDFDKLLTYIPETRTKLVLSRFEGYPTVVQVGALDENKNQIFTLQCIKHIKDSIPDIRFLIIGDGHKKAELIRWTLLNDLGKQVIFAGQMERMECLYLMSKTNILVLSSKGEGFPNVLLEAQALALPVVAFDVGSTSGIIDDGFTGYVIEKGDNKGFVGSAVKLLKDDNLAMRMGKMGKQRVFNYFGMNKKVERFLSMIDKDSLMIEESK